MGSATVAPMSERGDPGEHPPTQPHPADRRLFDEETSGEGAAAEHAPVEDGEDAGAFEQAGTAGGGGQDAARVLHVNFLDEGEAERLIGEAYGAETHRRLAELKAAHDPDNFFRINHNVRPSGGGA